MLQSFLAVVFVLTGTFESKAAPYQLDSGDVLEISVFKRDDLNRRMTIDADGNVWVPLIGEMRAKGLTLSALRSQLRDLLAAGDMVRGVDVMVDLVEHRPFYIYGSVMKSGAYPYRPGSTVRHALALAGGLSFMASSASGQGTPVSPVARAELHGKLEELKMQVAVQQIRIAGLRAEAETKNDISVEALPSEFVSNPQIKRLIQLETDRVKAHHAAREKEKQYLDEAIKLANERVNTLQQGLKADEEATQLQYQEFERVAELSRKGLAPTSRVSDQQQAAVLFKVRERDTAGRLALAQQSKEELLWKIATFDDRPVRVPREQLDALRTLEQLQAQVVSLSHQLMLSGASDMMLEKAGNIGLEIAVFRRSETGTMARIVGNEDSNLEAGDIVEVKANLDWLSSSFGN
jgi:polysaccharide export outer membrane protein